MRKLFIIAAVLAGLSVNAAAYFDGGAYTTSGPDSYRGTDLYFMAGAGGVWFRPSMSTYKSDALDKTYKTYRLRGGLEGDMYTLAGEFGSTPRAGTVSGVGNYSNSFVGGDITVSLTPGAGGKGRLAGPNARGGSRGGQGVTRIDVGAGLKQTRHEIKAATTAKTDQTEYSLFAGAKIMVVQLGATYTGYSYGKVKALPLIESVSGLSMPVSWYPKSSVNVRGDLTMFPMVTPFASYTSTKFKTVSNLKPDNSDAYAMGAYVDLAMVDVSAAWQVYDDGNGKDSFFTLGAGLKF